MTPYRDVIIDHIAPLETIDRINSGINIAPSGDKPLSTAVL